MKMVWGLTSKMAPPFASLMHAIHLGGGEQSPCTHGHKLDSKTGSWSTPTAAEK